MSPADAEGKAVPADLSHLGPVTRRRLAAVGITSQAELEALGAVDAYRRLKHAFPKEVSLNALWGLHATLTGMRWTDIDAATKTRLAAAARPVERSPGNP